MTSSTATRRLCESRVCLPGKFADEQPWVPYFWDLKDTRGQQQRQPRTREEEDAADTPAPLLKLWQFVVQPHDCEHFPELKVGQVVELAQSAKHGFITETKP